MSWDILHNLWTECQVWLHSLPITMSIVKSVWSCAVCNENLQCAVLVQISYDQTTWQHGNCCDDHGLIETHDLIWMQHEVLLIQLLDDLMTMRRKEHVTQEDVTRTLQSHLFNYKRTTCLLQAQHKTLKSVTILDASNDLLKLKRFVNHADWRINRSSNK